MKKEKPKFDGRTVTAVRKRIDAVLPWIKEELSTGRSEAAIIHSAGCTFLDQYFIAKEYLKELKVIE